MSEGKEMESLKQSIKTSFDKVKDDFMRHNLKIAVLERENIFLRREIEKLTKEVSKLTESIEARDAVDQEQIYAEETPSHSMKYGESSDSRIPVKSQVAESTQVLPDTDALERIFDKKIKEILKQAPLETKGSQKSHIVRQKPSDLSQKDDTGLENEFLRKLKRNKRDIIKQKILEQIQSKKLTTLELKELVVDKNQYCSKATFYRYLKDLRKEVPLGSMPDGEKNILVVMVHK